MQRDFSSYFQVQLYSILFFFLQLMHPIRYQLLSCEFDVASVCHTAALHPHMPEEQQQKSN